ncbi:MULTISPECIES: SDR family oxidoreductase [unclassified Streptomyces]|uniref:NAD(P)H-binding protein n=1 Tax=Streptomyces sp. NBC_00119 TaxID=2975659 RepID=A0AAU1U7F1_9ACTN|nr:MULTISPECIES: NAD(P)H-binding protein [unclassified Streptomyces]MCX4642717.1 NAD(P)H-binding protein [Streptomyces sp. NBC_01446]MCX5327658.1 NAD(P)H-binding protein [Streptomyces sp. NBC_00120]
MTILVTGARGNIGRRVLDRLHSAGHRHPLRASSRTPEELSVPAGVGAVQLDLNRPATFDAALSGVDKAFLYAESEGAKELFAAAARAGVRQVVLLSSSTVSGPQADSDPLAAHHAAVESALEASGVPGTVLRPGAFASNAFGWSHAISGGQPVRIPFPGAHTAPIHEDDIADVAVAVLEDDAYLGRTVELTGPRSLTFREQLGILGGLLGHEIPVHELTRDQAVEEMGRFVPAPILTSLLDQWAAAVDRPATVADAERVTGRPARTFEQWAKENQGGFTARD